MIVADKWHAPVLACPLHYYTTTDTLPHFAFSVFTLRIYLLYCLFPIIMHVARFQTFASITSAYRKMEHISLLSLRLQARSVLYGLCTWTDISRNDLDDDLIYSGHLGNRAILVFDKTIVNIVLIRLLHIQINSCKTKLFYFRIIINKGLIGQEGIK